MKSIVIKILLLIIISQVLLVAWTLLIEQRILN